MDLTQHAAFPILVICSAILVAKMVILGHATGIVRFRRASFAAPEDAEAFRQTGSKESEDPEVTRYLAAHRNDVESTLPFLAIGALYLATDPSAGMASVLFVAFTTLRVAFTLFYLLGLQPWRSISFLVAEVSVVVMVVQMAWWGVGKIG